MNRKGHQPNSKTCISNQFWEKSLDLISCSFRTLVLLHLWLYESDYKEQEELLIPIPNICAFRRLHEGDQEW